MVADQSFYNFKVGSTTDLLLEIPRGVFTPTGTTVALIESICSYVHKPGKLLDLGCGSGVAGISLYKSGLVTAPLYASDLSEHAVDCTNNNATRHGCSIIAKCGLLFKPWENDKFDYIVDDVSGVSEEVAKISPWFTDVPCQSGDDGASLIVEVLQKAPLYLNQGGLLFFPIISFSNVNRILTVAHDNFSHVERLTHQEWPLPKEMYQHYATLKELHKKGHISLIEKFGLIIWFTDIYVAF